MAALKEQVREAVAWYAGSGRGLNARLFVAFDEERQVYIVTSVVYPRYTDTAAVVVLVRIVGDRVVIEEDNTDRPLWQRLLQQGIPREKIILAYAGEPVPDPIEMP
ncbi:MAG: XisI protein [Anaerolineae bacterium]|nr:XisI protein [Anaerolineae bacterium]